MNKAFKKGVALAISLPLVLGIASCSAEEPPTDPAAQAQAEGQVEGQVEETADTDNTSHVNENGEFREAYGLKEILLPKGYENATPVWNYSFNNKDMNESQVVYGKDHVILVKDNEVSYRIVIIEKESGQTVLDTMVERFGEYSPGFVATNGGVEYFNIIQVGEVESDDPLEKGKNYAHLAKVDLTKDELAVESSKLVLDAPNASIQNEADLTDHNKSGYPFVKSPIGDDSDKVDIIFSSGDKLVKLSDLSGDYTVLNSHNGLPVYFLNDFEKGNFFGIKGNEKQQIDFVKLTGHEGINTLYQYDGKYAIVGDAGVGMTYLIDTVGKKVIMEREIPGEYGSSMDDLESVHMGDISDNQKYAAFSTVLFDIGSKKIVDMYETEDTQRVEFSHVDDNGVAYGQALEQTASVIYDMKSKSSKSSTSDSGQEFGQVMDTLSDGSLLIETSQDIIVIKKGDTSSDSASAEPAPSE